MLRAYALEDLQPIDAGHHHVEKNEIEVLAGYQLESAKAVFGLGDLKTVALKTTGENGPVFGDIVDDEQPESLPGAGSSVVGTTDMYSSRQTRRLLRLK
jgi:hypothetical protein